MRRFAHPARRPRAISYKSADDHWSQWGWRVSMKRPARAFSALHHALPGSFVISGDGTARVTTPAAFTPHERLRVALPSGKVSLRASAKGRLTVSVPLGPSVTRAAVAVAPRASR
jgi:hypothetical protein